MIDEIKKIVSELFASNWTEVEAKIAALEQIIKDAEQTIDFIKGMIK